MNMFEHLYRWARGNNSAEFEGDEEDKEIDLETLA